MTRLYIFADDSLQGREAGTPANLRGADYIAAELKRLVLEPAGEQGSWFQDVPLEHTALAADTKVLVGDAALPAADYLIFPQVGLPGVGALFNASGVPVIFGGRIGDPTLVAPDATKGRLVLFAPALGPAGWQFWARMGPAQYQRYATAGAAGLIIAALDLVPEELRGALEQGQVTVAGENGPAPTTALMFVTPAAAEAMMDAPLAGLLAGTEGKIVTAVGGNTRQPTPAPGRSVVAMVRGTDPVLRQQYVALGAHNDHDGFRGLVDHDSLRAFNTVVRPNGAEDSEKQATPAQLDTVRTLLDSLRALRPARPDSIMNGADDDGSGSMALLELAEYFAANPARRSILFVWHTAEEKGLFGAQRFTDQPTVPRDSIVAQLNLDMVGRGSAADITGGGPGYVQLIGSRRLSTQLGDLVEEVNTRGNHGFTFDYQFDTNGHPQQYYCRSDHYMYARYGIPIVFFSTGSHADYHEQTDEPQYIDYDKYARLTTLIMDLARTVANLDQRIVVDKPKPDPKGQCRQ
jgi:hypothetical protein